MYIYLYTYNTMDVRVSIYIEASLNFVSDVQVGGKGIASNEPWCVDRSW